MRAVVALLLAGLTACAATRDIYVGSDLADAAAPDAPMKPEREPEREPERDAGEPPAPIAANGPPAGAPAPPVVCAAGSGDCDGAASNGCEIDLLRDPNHCGACERRCDTPDCVCRDGQPAIACRPGRMDCDGAAANGCEIDITTSMQHCGGCNRACHMNGHDALAAVCTAGRCQITCQMEAFPEGNCDGDPDNGCETSLWTEDNCGACGVRCRCVNGVCV